VVTGWQKQQKFHAAIALGVLEYCDQAEGDAVAVGVESHSLTVALEGQRQVANTFLTMNDRIRKQDGAGFTAALRLMLAAWEEGG
jgi:hypothetical protein